MALPMCHGYTKTTAYGRFHSETAGQVISLYYRVHLCLAWCYVRTNDEPTVAVNGKRYASTEICGENSMFLCPLEVCAYIAEPVG